jgi:hypothetical protein
MRVTARSSSEIRCAICHDALVAGGACPRCSVRFHEECRAHLRRCPTLGCDGSANGPAVVWSWEPDVPGFGWGSVLRIGCVTLSILAVLAAICIPNVCCARKHGNEASAIGALKTIATSEAIFLERRSRYGSIHDLNDARLVDSVLGSGTKLGYLFEASDSHTDPLHLWFAVANPAIPGATGDRYFATNQAGVIFYTTASRLALDTSSCLLPNNGVIQIGK